METTVCMYWMIMDLNCLSIFTILLLRKQRRNWKKKAAVILMQFWMEQNIFTD